MKKKTNILLEYSVSALLYTSFQGSNVAPWIQIYYTMGIGESMSNRYLCLPMISPGQGYVSLLWESCYNFKLWTTRNVFKWGQVSNWGKLLVTDFLLSHHKHWWFEVVGCFWFRDFYLSESSVAQQVLPDTSASPLPLLPSACSAHPAPIFSLSCSLLPPKSHTVTKRPNSAQ